MDRRFASPSNLPTFMMPCPCCGGRMTHQPTRKVVADNLGDLTHACHQCGTEVTRTVRTSSDAPASPAWAGEDQPLQVVNG